MPELDQAIEIITDGGTALGVSCDDVYLKMMQDEDFALDVFASLHEGYSIRYRFAIRFEYNARKMILAAQRANEEVGNGLF